MGKIKRKRPRRGSLQYWPRSKASRHYPVIKNWPDLKESKPAGFLGYKSGMTRITLIDNRKKSPTKGEELTRAVTIIETPPIKAFGIRLYKESGEGLKCIGEVWSSKLDKELERKLRVPKNPTGDTSKLKEDVERADEVRILVHTQPKLAKIGKKKPEVLEIPVGGKNSKEAFNYASDVLGEEISVSDVLEEGDYMDVHAVTKGKGTQGVIKRFGVKTKHHKSEKGVRRVGTLGNWDAITWRVPHPGQMGYHQRTEKNKFLFKVLSPEDEEITPEGGFLKYGELNNNYLILDGSIPGPKKRPIILTPSMRPPEKGISQTPEIVHYSKSSQQS